MIVNFAPKINIPISKVIEKKRFTKRDFRELIRLTENISALMRADLAKGIKAFQRKINLYDIELLISRGLWKDLPKVIDWKGFNEIARKDIEHAFDKALLGGQKASLPFFYLAAERLIPNIRDVALPFSLKNPRILAWKESRLDWLSTRLDEGTIKAIDKVINLNYQFGTPPRDAARIIRSSIGLNDRQAVALTRYREGLVSKGISGKKLDQMVGGYSDRLIKQRSETIAWTETNNAINKGQMEVWNQAEEAGFIETQNTYKTWMTRGDDLVCDICLSLENQTVRIDEDFIAISGESFNSPIAHPNCNCLMTIDIRG